MYFTFIEHSVSYLSYFCHTSIVTKHMHKKNISDNVFNKGLETCLNPTKKTELLLPYIWISLRQLPHSEDILHRGS